MRILGKCPNCGSEDTIHDFWRLTGKWEDRNKVKCDACGKVWEDWLNLKGAEEAKGNKLIPVEVTRSKHQAEEYGIKLDWLEKREIPWCGMIISALNSALITRFNLDVCLATEGGVEGIYKGCYIELKNCDRELGLLVGNYYQKEGLKEILDFYEEMLRYLFVKNFTVGKRNYRRGKILKLSEEGKDCKKAQEILIAVLTKSGGEKFARKVLDKIQKIRRNPFAVSYVKGLTNEEIAQLFVPPL